MNYSIIFLVAFLSFSVFSKTQEKVIEHVNISVGKHSLSFNYIEGSKPAIVFESGSDLNITSSYWNNIMKTLSSEVDNAIISYDRAGYNKSDLPNEPYKIENETLWLRKGLEHLGYADSIIYVGHSYAYYLLKMYEAKYPESIHSMIYIDPVTVTFIESMGGIKEELKHFDLSLLPDTKFGKALVRETKGMTETFNRVKNLHTTKPINCFVISAENQEWSSEKEIAKWKLGHQKLSKQCGNKLSGNNLIVAKGSHHDVPGHSPQVIVKTLVSFLKQ